MPLSTVTLQSRLNWLSTQADLLPLSNVGGFSNEPGLTLCNDALADLITDPNDWTFNRVEMPTLFTCSNKQDYLFAGACAFSLTVNPTNNQPQAFPSMGWAIDLATNNAVTVTGGVVTINTIEPHRFTVGQTVYLTGLVATTGTAANYNSVFTDNGSVSQWNTGYLLTAVGTNSISFAAVAGQNNGDVLGAPGITNFGYGTSSTLQELNNNSSPPNQNPCTFRRELPIISRVANPSEVCVLADLGTGIIKIRFHMVPGTTIWGANLVYQAKAPLKTSLTQTWSPFPDNLQTVYDQALLYRGYRYIGDQRADSEYQKLQAAIFKAQGTDEGASTDVELRPSEPIMDSLGWNGWW